MDPSRYCHLSKVSFRGFCLRTCKVKKSRKLKGKIIARSLFAVLRFSLAAFRLALACATSAAAAFASIAAGILCTTFVSYSWGSCDPERVRVISIARLRTLPPMHLQPIDVIVFDDPCVEILS